MSHCQEMNYVVPGIKRIDDPIVTYAKTKSVTAGQMVVRECREPKAHLIDFRFYPRLNQRREFEKCSIEATVTYL
jgi:hypothetical protein